MIDTWKNGGPARRNAAAELDTYLQDVRVILRKQDWPPDQPVVIGDETDPEMERAVPYYATASLVGELALATLEFLSGPGKLSTCRFCATPFKGRRTQVTCAAGGCRRKYRDAWKGAHTKTKRERDLHRLAQKASWLRHKIESSAGRRRREYQGRLGDVQEQRDRLRARRARQ